MQWPSLVSEFKNSRMLRETVAFIPSGNQAFVFSLREPVPVTSAHFPLSLENKPLQSSHASRENFANTYYQSCFRSDRLSSGQNPALPFAETGITFTRIFQTFPNPVETIIANVGISEHVLEYLGVHFETVL